MEDADRFISADRKAWRSRAVDREAGCYVECAAERDRCGVSQAETDRIAWWSVQDRIPQWAWSAVGGVGDCDRVAETGQYAKERKHYNRNTPTAVCSSLFLPSSWSAHFVEVPSLSPSSSRPCNASGHRRGLFAWSRFTAVSARGTQLSRKRVELLRLQRYRIIAFCRFGLVPAVFDFALRNQRSEVRILSGVWSVGWRTDAFSFGSELITVTAPALVGKNFWTVPAKAFMRTLQAIGSRRIPVPALVGGFSAARTCCPPSPVLRFATARIQRIACPPMMVLFFSWVAINEYGLITRIIVNRPGVRNLAIESL